MHNTANAGIRWRRLAPAILIGVILNAGVFLIGRAAGASMEITDPTMTITVWTILFGTAVPLLLFGLIAWAGSRRVPALRTWFAWAGLAFAVLPAVSPFLFAADLTSAIALAIIHVVAGVVWFIGLAPWQSPVTATTGDAIAAN